MKCVRPSNYAMQRTGTDKVLGRGRESPAPVDIHRAREPICWRAVADGGRYTAQR